jgi:uncharacterized protein (TIGR00730 family)
MVTIRTVCVFCGSSAPPDGRYAAAARELGTLVASSGHSLVYGGGRSGLMGHIADAALAAGGEVTGVIPVGLFSREIPHTGLTALHEVGTMHERKQLMYDLSDGFIALPGGLGTLEELAEVSTWSQLGLHAKPLVLLDVDSFWDPLTAQLDRMVEVGLLQPANRALVQHAGTAERALEILATAAPAAPAGTITEGQR